jgi:hypothetical protein
MAASAMAASSISALGGRLATTTAAGAATSSVAQAAPLRSVGATAAALVSTPIPFNFSNTNLKILLVFLRGIGGDILEEI